MNLEDLLEPKDGLLTDDFCGTLFGKGSQLKVVGWSGKIYSRKRYILFCSLCAEDPELFGEGYFRSVKCDLKVGKLPCGCSPHKKTEEQCVILCTRAATKLGHKFIYWAEPFKGVYTKCELECIDHGTWKSTGMYSLVTNGHSCPSCAYDKTAKRFSKTDEEMIAGFLSTGAFSEGTLFSRSQKLNKRGYPSYWCVKCSRCSFEYESDYSNLRAGKLGCKCSNRDFDQCYINLITDSSVPIALKFGVSKNSHSRVASQNRSSTFKIENFGIWSFSNRTACIKAEHECFSTLDCGILSKVEMPDGWTETTHVYNLEKIIQIYEKNGGVRMND